MSATSSASGSGGRPRGRGGGLLRIADRCWRVTPSASAIGGHRPSPGQRGRAQQQFFWACGPGHGLAEQLVLHGLLTQQPLQLAHLRLQRTVLRRRHHLLAGCSCGQGTLVHQPAPREHLTAADAMLAGNERHAHPGQIRLLDDPDLLFRCPPPPALHTGKNLAVIVTSGRTVSHMPHSYPRARPCQVI